MFPFLTFTIFNHIVRIPMYGLCMAIGAYAAFMLAAILVKRKNLNIWDFFIISACVIGFGLAGARILYVLVSYPIVQFFKHVFLQNEGLVFYGGLIFVPLGYVTGCRISKVKAEDFAGIFAFAIPFAHGFGRIGCFCGGCCYGIPYNGILAVQYKTPLSSVSTEITVFPVQLLEAFLLFILAAVIFFMEISSVPSGKNEKKCQVLKEMLLEKIWSKIPEKWFSLIFYIQTYSVIRFCLEFLRGDRERGKAGIFSTSQIISLICFSVALIIEIIFSFRKNGKTTSE